MNGAIFWEIYEIIHNNKDKSPEEIEKLLEERKQYFRDLLK